MIPLTLDEVPAGYIGWELFTKGSPDNSIFFPTRRAAEGYSRRFCGRCDLTFERHRPSDAEMTAFWLAETERVKRDMVVQ